MWKNNLAHCKVRRGAEDPTDKIKKLRNCPRGSLWIFEYDACL